MTSDPWQMEVSLKQQAIDRDQVLQAAAVLFDPDGLHVLQALPSARWHQVQAGKADQLVNVATALSDEKGLYFSLNPIKPSYLAGNTSSEAGRRHFNNGDIEKRNWLLIDVDPTRPAGTSATDAEREAAMKVLASAVDSLLAKGWPCPVWVDSGNGFHAYFKVDLPNDDLSTQLLKACLKQLKKDFDTDFAGIDPKVYAAKQITKLPGSWARKGENSAERPHRMARLLFVPEDVLAVSLDQLQQLAGQVLPKPANGHTTFDPWSMTVGQAGDREAGYAKAALAGEVGKVAICRHLRNDQLYESALKLGGYVGAGLLERGEVERQLEAAAAACGLGQDGDPAEVTRAIKNGLEAGLANPKHVPAPASQQASQALPAGLPARLVIGADEVEPEKVDWLWPDRLAFGFITLLAGRTGVGKSFIMLDLACRMSRGEAFPDGSRCRKAGTLVISEDPIQYMLVPRVIEMEGDRSRIKFMTWQAMSHYTLSNIDMLEMAWQQSGQPGLVLVDPPANFLGGKDEGRNAEVRSVLMKLVEWLDRRHVAACLITHFNKGSASKGVDALDRIMSSVAWASTARIALAAGKDDQEGCCVLAGIKSNLGQMPASLAYQIRPTADLAVVDWKGVHQTTADELIATAGNHKAKRSQACAWLVARFQERLEWFRDDLFKHAAAEGISKNQVYQAAELLRLPGKIRPRKVKGPGETWLSIWWAPPDWGPLIEGMSDAEK